MKKKGPQRGSDCKPKTTDIGVRGLDLIALNVAKGIIVDATEWSECQFSHLQNFLI